MTYAGDEDSGDDVTSGSLEDIEQYLQEAWEDSLPDDSYEVEEDREAQE